MVDSSFDDGGKKYLQRKEYINEASGVVSEITAWVVGGEREENFKSKKTGRPLSKESSQKDPKMQAYLGKIDGVDAATSKGSGSSSANIGF